MVKEKVEGEAAASKDATAASGRAWRNPYSTSLTHLPRRAFGTVAAAYGDRTEDAKAEGGGALATTKTPDEVLQAKNHEENRRKSEYKYARLGAEGGRKSEVRFERSASRPCFNR